MSERGACSIFGLPCEQRDVCTSGYCVREFAKTLRAEEALGLERLRRDVATPHVTLDSGVQFRDMRSTRSEP